MNYPMSMAGLAGKSGARRKVFSILFVNCLVTLGICTAELRAQRFQDRTSALGLSGLGNDLATWIDYNNDGWVDLHVGGMLWRNNGGQSFTAVAGLGGSGVWGDFNNDGYPDVFTYGYRMYRNNGGNGSFTQIAIPTLPMNVTLGMSWADHNNDGFIDLYIGGYENPNYLPDAILRNNGGTSFSLVWQESGDIDPGRGVTSCDFDEDGDQDIYVSNYRLEANDLWLNNGSGVFTDVAQTYGVAGIYDGWDWSYGHTIGSCWGDLDNDGHFDLFVGNFSHPDSWQDRPRFYRNRGPSGNWYFEDRSSSAGLAWQESYASPTLGDYDNNGTLDLYFTTVYAVGSGGIPNYPVLYRNNGNWTFTDVTSAEGLANLPPTYQAAWADFDNDGDLDLVTAGKLFVNTTVSTNRWLRVRLTGEGTINRSAIGAQVRVTMGSQTVTRQVEAGTGQGNQNDFTLVFGLGSTAGPVNMEVRWPDRSVMNLSSPVNQTVVLTPAPDTTPPTGSVVINNGADYVADRAVTLTLSASDNGTGVSQMRFSNDNVLWGSWTAYATSKTWNLTSGNGPKTVYAQFKDQAGNVSAVYSDGTYLDIDPPFGSIVINAGGSWTNFVTVTLTLSATDIDSGVYQMRFSNDNVAWSNWEAYATVRGWTMLAGDGLKTVYAQYQDRAGNLSVVSNDTITLDQTAPIPGTAVIPATAHSAPITITYSGAGDVLSGLKNVKLWYKKDAGSWTQSTNPVQTGSSGSFAFNDLTGDGTYYFDLRAEDNANNRSALPTGNGDGACVYTAWHRLSGTIGLNDFVANPATVSVTVELRKAGGGTTVRTVSAGAYTISDVEPGTYSVAYKASHWLQRTLAGVVVTGDVSNLNVALVNGDSDGDNEITTSDLANVLSAMNALPGDPNWLTEADLDGDGEVTTSDLATVLTGLDQMGDP